MIKNIGARIKILSKTKLILIAIGVVLIGSFGAYRLSRPVPKAVSYQTTNAQKGTLIISTSGSGTISSSNNTSITTKASGVVSKVYVTNGQAVVKGQKIADLTLDEYGQERQATAYSAYVDAQVAAKTADAAKDEADIQMWTDRQAIFDAIDDIDYKNNNAINPNTKEDYTDSEKMIIDKTLAKNEKTFLASELKYKTANAAISKANAGVVSAWKDYQQAAASIVAPASGVINNLALSAGTVVASSTSSNSSGTPTVTAQNIGKVTNPDGQLQATVNLTEVDIVGIKANQKVTLIVDVFSDKTLTGKVLSVDTDGGTSSGVTSYPVTILLDPTNLEIYPNMSVSVEIIKNLKTDIILVPSSAVNTNNSQSTVTVMKDGQPTDIPVEIGLSNDSQTEIVSGINEGEVIVTSTTSTQQSTTTTTGQASPFSGLSGRSGSSQQMFIRDGGAPRF